MDPLTHTLAGAALGEGFFKKHLGPAALPTLMLAANLPDIDGIAMFFPMEAAITMRRTFGHSLFLIPLWSLALAHLLRLRYKDHGIRPLYWGCLAGALLHVFLDLINSFGVVLLWPFSLWRPELASVFIIDLSLTGILILPWLKRSQGAFRWSIRLAAVYLLFCLAGRWRAESLLKEARQAIKTDFSYVFPEPFGPHRFRGVALADGQYSLYLISVLSATVEKRSVVSTFPEDPAVLKAMLSPLGRRLTAFFKAPVWAASTDGTVKVYDLRFRSILLQRKSSFEYTLTP